MHKLKQLFKYTGLACLALILLAFSSIKNNAFPLMGKVALAEQVTDKVNGITYSAPYISLSITSSTGSDDPNITLTTPEGGGIATGWHTLSVKTNAYDGFVAIATASNDGKLVSASDSTNCIESIDCSSVCKLSENTWGIAFALTGDSSNDNYQSTDQSILQNAYWYGFDSNDPFMFAHFSNDSHSDMTLNANVYYGANVSRLKPAGTYSTKITYTVTADLPSTPTITSVEPDTLTAGDSETVSDEDRTITITGTNLTTVYNVWVDIDGDGELDTGSNSSISSGSDESSSSNGSTTVDEACTSITLDTTSPDTKLTCIAPATETAGTYYVYVETQGGVSSKSDNAQLTYEKKVDPVGIHTITTMQEMTSDICKANTTPDKSATVSDTTGEHQGDTNYVPEKTLTDTRDGTSYTIRKLADGNCWMVENLALGTNGTSTGNGTTTITEDGMILTKADTDLNSSTDDNYTWILPTYDTIGATWSKSTNDAHVIEGSTTASTNWQQGMGNWYTWGAATAGSSANATTRDAEAEDSICSKGWRLPYGGSKSAWSSTTSKSFGNLLYAYGQTSSSSASSATLRAMPLNFTYAGYYNYYNGRIRDIDRYGYYWSAIAFDSYYAFDLYFDSSTVYLSHVNFHSYGLSVRCVAK